MSVNIKRNGTLQKLADQTLIFDANCAEVRTGTYSIECISNSGANATITFSTPMPDNNYIVIFKQESPAAGEIGFRTCTTTGFNLFVLGGRYDIAATAMTFTGTYYAFKLVELEGYTNIYNKITNSIDSSPTQNSTNFVTSGGVYDAIVNSASSFIGTQEEWENLSVAQQSQYEIVFITDDEVAVESEFQYSTSEQWTGKRWIDGKKIYTRVLTGFEITGDSGSWQTISGATIPNAGVIVCATTLRNTPGDNFTYFPRFDTQILSTGEIRILNLMGELSSPINTIILEYTKTTD